MKNNVMYDAVIVGAGHNGLIAACYLAMAGLSVLILEKNETVGGATYSKKVFPGIDARVSVYSYLISLLPNKILTDLGISLEIRRRAISSYTPVEKGGKHTGLLISNVSEDITQQSFRDLTGSEREYEGYQKLQSILSIFAQKVWPTLLSPLLSKQDLQKQFQTREEREVWTYLVEKPISALIEEHLSDDTVRGAVFTDAKIGVPTYADDPSLLQNRTFIYHTIGQGTGEWRVPVGGMGALIDALKARAQGLGVVLQTSADVFKVDHGLPISTLYFMQDGKESAAAARYVLFNTSSDIANRCLPGVYSEQQVEGSVFKINMVLKKLPEMKAPGVSARDAFTGTFHLHEGYENLQRTYENASAGIRMDAIPRDKIPGEMYCHSLTDPSILSQDLQEKGYQTLTLFGLDVPYQAFVTDNDAVRTEITQRYLSAINHFTTEDIAGCLAVDAEGKPCLEAKSPLDLEQSLGLPKGNIFHGNLTWPFAEYAADAGTWGVETIFANVYMCGSSAKRGGAVSGIPGHHAAMKILGRSA
jgi:phytoene dehydrogenase-like protein